MIFYTLYNLPDQGNRATQTADTISATYTTQTTRQMQPTQPTQLAHPIPQMQPMPMQVNTMMPKLFRKIRDYDSELKYDEKLFEQYRNQLLTAILTNDRELFDKMHDSMLRQLYSQCNAVLRDNKLDDADLIIEYWTNYFEQRTHHFRHLRDAEIFANRVIIDPTFAGSIEYANFLLDEQQFRQWGMTLAELIQYELKKNYRSQ